MIFGHFGGNSVPGPEFIEDLSRMGHKVLLSERVSALKNYNSNIVLCEDTSIDEIAKKCDGVCPNGEINTAKYAYLHKKYNFIGVCEKVAKTSIDKCLCEKILSSAKGVRYKLSAKYFMGKEIHDNEVVSMLKHKLPLIIKPSATNGSNGVSVVFNEEDLEKALEFAKKEVVFNSNQSIVIEEFIEGDEFSMDGIIINGVCFPLLCMRQRMGQFPYRNEVEFWGGDIFNSDKICLVNGVNTYTKYKKEDIFEAFFEACKILGANNCFVQGDVIVNDNGVYIVDISARPNGTGRIFRALGINRARIYLEAFYDAFKDDKLLGSDRLEYNLNRNFCWRLFELNQGVIKKVPEYVPLNTIYYECNLKEGDVITPVINGANDLSWRGDIIIESTPHMARLEAQNYLNSFCIG